MKELVIEIEGLAPGHSVSVALKEDLTISDDLERECKRGAALFGYYAVLSEKAVTKCQVLKAHFEDWKAIAEDQLIKSHKDGRKAFKTVKDITRELRADAKFLSFEKKISEVDEHARILKQVARAFEMKSSLIQTMNANRRKEMG